MAGSRSSPKKQRSRDSRRHPGSSSVANTASYLPGSSMPSVRSSSRHPPRPPYEDRRRLEDEVRRRRLQEHVQTTTVPRSRTRIHCACNDQSCHIDCDDEQIPAGYQKASSDSKQTTTWVMGYCAQFKGPASKNQDPKKSDDYIICSSEDFGPHPYKMNLRYTYTQGMRCPTHRATGTRAFQPKYERAEQFERPLLPKLDTSSEPSAPDQPSTADPGAQETPSTGRLGSTPVTTLTTVESYQQSLSNVELEQSCAVQGERTLLSDSEMLSNRNSSRNFSEPYWQTSPSQPFYQVYGGSQGLSNTSSSGVQDFATTNGEQVLSNLIAPIPLWNPSARRAIGVLQDPTLEPSAYTRQVQGDVNYPYIATASLYRSPPGFDNYATTDDQENFTAWTDGDHVNDAERQRRHQG